MGSALMFPEEIHAIDPRRWVHGLRNLHHIVCHKTKECCGALALVGKCVSLALALACCGWSLLHSVVRIFSKEVFYECFWS
jgi:hypothetical protein